MRPYEITWAVSIGKKAIGVRTESCPLTLRCGEMRSESTLCVLNVSKLYSPTPHTRSSSRVNLVGSFCTKPTTSVTGSSLATVSQKVTLDLATKKLTVELQGPIFQVYLLSLLLEGIVVEMEKNITWSLPQYFPGEAILGCSTTRCICIWTPRHESYRILLMKSLFTII